MKPGIYATKKATALDVVKSKIEKEHGKGAIMKNEETSAACRKTAKIYFKFRKCFN